MNNGQRYKVLGNFLRDKRKSAELSQADIARELGYDSAQFVSNWERGLAAPPFSSLPIICKKLKIPNREMIDLILQETELELKAKFSKASKARRA